MLELTLFALLGIFYWAYTRSRSKNERRWSVLVTKLERLDSELKAKEARWSEIKSRLQSLEQELEKLQGRFASPENQGVEHAAGPAVLPGESKPPAVNPLLKSVQIPPAAVIPPLSSESAARLPEAPRPAEGQSAMAPPSLPTPTPIHPAGEMRSPGAKEPIPPPAMPPSPVAGDVLKLEYPQIPAVSPPVGTARSSSTLPQPHFTVRRQPGPTTPERLKRLLNLEEVLGTNYLIKLGVVFVVIGVSGFILSNFDKIPTWLQLLTGFLVGIGMLISGTRFEAGKYRLLARAAMGGGWALIFFTTWALHHAGKQPLLSSEPLDFALLLIVAAAMVLHTLKYQSQLVTGFAFLLPSLTVTVTLGFASGVTDAVRIPALVGSGILALGLVLIVLWRRWFELEVFGIVATYLNHYFWIRPIVEHGSVAAKAASFFSSAALLVAYWVIFRTSYIIRKVDNRSQEATSSVAALLNTFFLLGLLKYQAVHPELAFWSLLALGAVELTLGQLPITRRRRAAFVILTTLGATFLVAAVPFKFSGATLPVILLAEAETFFLAGVFTREIVFRRLGMLAGLLVAFKMAWLALAQIVTPNFNGLAGAEIVKAMVVYGFATVVFYANSHWVPRRWPDLIQTSLEDWSFRGYSYIAGSVAFVGLWLILPMHWLAVAWAFMALALALAARWLKLRQLARQSHLLAAAGFFAAFGLNLLNLEPHHFAMLPLETVLLTAVLLYACSHHLRLTPFPGEAQLSATHAWTATLLLALLSWYELRAEYVAPAWMLLAFIVGFAGRELKLKRYSFQAYVLTLVAPVGAIAINLMATTPHTHSLIRLITVSMVAAMLYVCSRWAALVEVGGARTMSALQTWLGTAILAMLAWYENPSEFSAPIWCGMALALIVLGSALRRRSLAVQGHCLAAAGITCAFVINLRVATLGHLDGRLLLTVGACAAFLYLSSLWSGSFEAAKRLKLAEFHTWAASTLAFLLVWYELQPVAVAVGWALFGIVLFEVGIGRRSLSLRLQSYFVLAASFARIFYVNVNAAGSAGEISPRVWTMLFLAAAFFFVYARLAASTGDFIERDRKLESPALICYFGSITIVTLMRAELDPHWVVTGWAAMVVVLLALDWRLRRGIFLQQGLILSFAVLFRTVLFNFYESQRMLLASEHTRLVYTGPAVALLFLAVPLASRLRPDSLGSASMGESRLARVLAGLSRYPDQVVFFIAFGLLTTLLYLEIPNTVTLAWGAEALAVFLFALWVGVRSFRLAAIGLLLVCVARIVLVDLWRFEGNSRWITGIGLGISLIAVGYMSIRHREAIRKYL